MKRALGPVIRIGVFSVGLGVVMALLAMLLFGSPTLFVVWECGPLPPLPPGEIRVDCAGYETMAWVSFDPRFYVVVGILAACLTFAVLMAMRRQRRPSPWTAAGVLAGFVAVLVFYVALGTPPDEPSCDWLWSYTYWDGTVAYAPDYERRAELGWAPCWQPPSWPEARFGD